MTAGTLDRLTADAAARVRRYSDAAKHPTASRVVRIAAHVSAAALLALFPFGTVMLGTMLRWVYVAVGVLLLAVVPVLLDGLAKRSRLVHLAAITPVAVVVPVVALLGFDVLWSWARLPRPLPAIGLVIAGAVVAAMTYTYLRWVGRPAPPHHRLWALYAAVVALALLALTSHEPPDLRSTLIAAAAGAATWLYLQQTVGHQVKHPLWWALLLVGVAIVAAPLLAEAIQGGKTSPVLLITGAVIAAVAGLNGLWLPRGSDDLKRTRRAVGTAFVFGVAVPLLVAAFVWVTSVAPAAPNATPVPAAAATTTLPRAAYDHRPILLFDGDERFRTPLDVDRMLATGDVQLCPEGRGLLADCRTINSASDLRNGFGNLRFDTQQIQDDDLPTTIYAHAVSDKLNPGWIDIDYWWYLPDNPANTALGAMCGAGLVIPEITCFDHQSDWEGVTVVVDDNKNPVAVHFAAHSHVINVPWSTLQAATAGKALQPFAAGRDVANHPLVFIARGTHAAYPLPCRESTCAGDSAFEDNRHDGAHVWPEEPCTPSGCVTAFPRTAHGAADASWNAFDGHWGSAVCVAKVYCARSSAPRAPANQGRFKRPWCYDFAAGANPARPHPEIPCHRGA